MREYVDVDPIIHTFNVFCLCNMPDGVWDTVICDSCFRTFHQRCHLMGQVLRGKGIADRIGKFFCYTCRIPSNYDYMDQKATAESIDNEAIKNVAGRIRNLPSFKLTLFMPNIIHQNWFPFIPSSLEQYRVVESIFKKYDLNTFCQKQGEIYAALCHFYQNNINETPVKNQ